MENQHKKLIYESLHSQIYRVQDHIEGQVHTRILKKLKGEYPSLELVARFQREYELTRKLGQDPSLNGVIQVDSLHKEKSTWVITMEDFGGKSLALHLKERLEKNQRMDVLELLNLSIKMCQILDQIHQQGIIHKDVNPSNFVWNSKSGQLKIIDFGISAELPQETTRMQAPENLEGTLAYLSPEQTGRMNRCLDFRSDLYSLGVSFYQLFTGELPFIARDSLELVHAHLAVTAKPACKISEIPEVLSLIFDKLMLKNAEERYQSAHGLQMDLQWCLNHLLNKVSAGLPTASSPALLPDFELGKEDQLEQFHLSQRLFGREEEIHLLKQALESTAGDSVGKGKKEVIWITGDSGVGKSALVGEVRQWTLQKRGYFVEGKFDQINQGLPYSSMIGAFQGLVQQLLAEPPESLALWKKKLTENLEGNGQLILEIIPEVELILGPQPSVVQVSASFAQHRLQSTFQRFIRTFASSEKVLVLFLDDLQWADQALLDLLSVILVDEKLENFFFLGAYRNREVSETHPLSKLLLSLPLAIQKINPETRSASRAKGGILSLSPLRIEAIVEMLKDTFQCSEEAAQTLSEILLQKTEGNPFFIKQFLAHLVKLGEICFDREQKRWGWKIERIEQIEIAENVALLLIEKIQDFSLPTQKCLQLASCLGNQFDLENLEWVSLLQDGEAISGQRQSILEELLHQPLKELLQAGFLIPLDENYKYGGVGNPRYRFVHDQVQQAAYTLIPEEDRPQKHKRIGEFLLGKLTGEERNKYLFDIVGHWNLGRSLLQKGRLTDQEKIKQLVSLNYQAGKKAKHALAREQAFEYFQIAIEFSTGGMVRQTNQGLLTKQRAAVLQEDDYSRFDLQGWEKNYEQTLDLYLKGADMASVTDHEREMKEWIEVIVDQSKSPYDCIRAENIQGLFYHDITGEYQKALDLALCSLQRIGIAFPNKPSRLHFFWEYRKLRQKFKQKSLQELIQIPQISQSNQKDVLELMGLLYVSACIARPMLLFLTIFKIITLSLDNYGHSPIAILYYIVLAQIHCAEGNFQESKKMLDLVSQLLPLFQDQALEVKVLYEQYVFLGPFEDSLETCMEKLEQGTGMARQLGNLRYVDLFFGARMVFLYNQELNLSNLEKELNDGFAEIHSQLSYHLILGEALSYWQGEGEVPLGDSTLGQQNATTQSLDSSLKDTSYIKPREIQLFGEYFTRSDFDRFEKEKNGAVLFYYFFYQMQLAYEFGNYELALEALRETGKYINVVQGFFLLLGIYLCFESLIFLRVNPSLRKVAKLRSATWGKFSHIQKSRSKLKKWAEVSPLNFRPLWLLVEAERHRFEGKAWQAPALYQEAIEIFRKARFLRFEGLANELAAQFHSSNSQGRFPWLAQGYLRQAHHCYQLWGATAKVKYLESCYPQLRALLDLELGAGGAGDYHQGDDGSGVLHSEGGGSGTCHLGDDGLEDSLLSMGVNLTNSTLLSTVSNTGQRGDDLDWDSLTKASQAISKEIELEPLCKHLLEIMLENIGAEKGLLLINTAPKDTSAEKNSDVFWEIKAESSGRVSVQEVTPMLSSKGQSIVFQQTDGRLEAQKKSQYFSTGMKPEEVNKLSLGVFRYVLKTKKPLIINNVSKDQRFQNDPYVLQHQLKSIFCLPILQQQNLLAIAYFENNLSAGVFTGKHSKVLQVLALQAAFSLENARKHLEIQEAQMQLVQSEKMAGLGVLIAGVGHEIRNPLSAMSLIAQNFDTDLQKFQSEVFELLNDHDGVEAQFFKERFSPFFHNLKLLEEGNLRLKKIVESLQSFSYMGRGEMELEDPIKALDNTLQLIQTQYDRQILFETQFLEKPRIRCFLGALNQVFLNLIVNACQAILEKKKKEENQGKLRITSEVVQGELCIQFQDNGCGMSKEVQQKMFALFFSTKAVGEGTGLGMHISQKTIQQHGGRIEVHSVLGEGSIISLYLPIS